MKNIVEIKDFPISISLEKRFDEDIVYLEQGYYNVLSLAVKDFPPLDILIDKIDVVSFKKFIDSFGSGSCRGGYNFPYDHHYSDSVPDDHYFNDYVLENKRGYLKWKIFSYGCYQDAVYFKMDKELIKRMETILEVVKKYKGRTIIETSYNPISF